MRATPGARAPTGSGPASLGIGTAPHTGGMRGRVLRLDGRASVIQATVVSTVTGILPRVALE